MSTISTRFYVTGGNLEPDAPSYVERKADNELYVGLNQGELCYVLDSSQKGKSSLMARIRDRLLKKGVAVAACELSGLGTNVTPEQWYKGLLGRIGEDLELEDALEDFWLNHEDLGPVRRWVTALREVVLSHRDGRVVIFLDEINSVRNLPFSTDEFFAAIRECYNRRVHDPVFARLTFCFLGVATPADLIRDPRTTPFNIGQRIELEDFSETEAAPLAQGLGRNDKVAARLLRRILYWTGGHPYLTQRLCQAVANDPTVTNTRGVDRICTALFFSPAAREQDVNLSGVQRFLLRNEADSASLLELYRQICRGYRVRNDETNQLVSVLRLSGIVRLAEGSLRVRNRIYQQVFDRAWVRENMPDAELRRQRLALWRGVAWTAAAFTLLILAGLAYWDVYYRVHTEYYAHFVNRWGLPEGIGPVAAEQARHRFLTYKLTRRGHWGPGETVETINRDGQCTPGGTSPYIGDDSKTTECLFVYERDPQTGHASKQEAYDPKGRLVWAFQYTSPQTGHYTDESGFPRPRTDSGATYLQFSRSPEGFEQEHTYFDKDGKPQPNYDGSFGILREYDGRGLLTGLTYLGEDGKAVRPKGSEYAKFTSKHDEHGNITEWSYFGEYGQPVRLLEGYAKITRKYDEYGNVIERAYFDERGQPARHKEGYGKLTRKYDERANIVEEAYYDEHGQPVRLPDGYARIARKYDDQGRGIEWAYFAENGQPTRHKEGYARVTKKYDDQGREVEWACFDESGQPTRSDKGYAKSKRKYDERGNMIEEAYFDEREQLTLNEHQYAKATGRYDERGNLIEVTFFDKHEHPSRQGNRCAKVTMKRDARGNMIERVCFDERERLVQPQEGYAKVTKKYDERDNVIEETSFDEHGQPKVTKMYDERGNVIEETSFDEHGQPKVTKMYDEWGNVIQEPLSDIYKQPYEPTDPPYSPYDSWSIDPR